MVAAGLIVMLAIAGLLVIGIPFIGKLGVGAAIAVGGVVLSALTVLMALIGAFSRGSRPRSRSTFKPSAAFERWGERVTARPWLSIAGGVLIMLIFASPVTQLRLGQPDDGNQPEGKLQRVAYDRLSAAFGAGSNGPFIIAVDTADGADAVQADLTSCRKPIAGTDGVAQAAPATPSQDGEMATIFAIPTSAPQDEATSELLDRLRDETIPQATQGTPLADKVFIGGAVPVFEDLSDKVASRLPVFILDRDRPVRAAADHGLPLALDPARLGRSSTCCRCSPPTAWSSRSSRWASARAWSARTRTCRSSRSSRSCCSRSCSA